MNVIKSFLIGLTAAAIVWAAVTVIGFNVYTWSLILYLYVALAVLVAVDANIDSEYGSLLNYLKNLRARVLFVVDEEERKVKQVLTGEEFKILDSEKVQ